MKNSELSPLTLQSVTTARQRLDGAIRLTPCVHSSGLSKLTGSHISCKLEYCQRTGSFKERGARNALALLDPRTRGVIAASAGNHALGLAWHGRAFSLPVTVVMPRLAPVVKIDRCRSLGANVILQGDNYDQAHAHAIQLARARGLDYIHPFDDPRVMAGQGTVALEVLEQVPDLEAILVPVGGGGLLAGVTTVLRALKPEVTIIGVEPQNAACFAQAIERKRPVHLAWRHTLADGLAVEQAGQHTFAVVANLVDRIVTVSEEEIALAMLRLTETEEAVVEGAGAVGLAALLGGHAPELKGKRVVLLLTGGNIDPLTHRHAVESARARNNSYPEFRFHSLRPGAPSPRNQPVPNTATKAVR